MKMTNIKIGSMVVDHLTNRFVRVIGVQEDLRNKITIYLVDNTELEGKRFYNEISEVKYETFH